MGELKYDAIRERLEKKPCDIYQTLLAKLGLKTSTKYCSIHKTNYTCVIEVSTGNSSSCPLCDEENEKREKEFHPIIDGLPKRYKNATFASYVVSNKNQDEIKAKVISFATKPIDKWLFMLGNNGTGKTHLALAILKTTGGVYREYDDITQELLDAQNKGKGDINEIINKYTQAKMLVIDEIDKVKNTDGRVRYLNIILRKRYANMLPTIILGNININTLCENIDIPNNNGLKDRIREVGTILNFNWESYRAKH